MIGATPGPETSATTPHDVNAYLDSLDPKHRVLVAGQMADRLLGINSFTPPTINEASGNGSGSVDAQSAPNVTTRSTTGDGEYGSQNDDDLSDDEGTHVKVFSADPLQPGQTIGVHFNSDPLILPNERGPGVVNLLAQVACFAHQEGQEPQIVSLFNIHDMQHADPSVWALYAREGQTDVNELKIFSILNRNKRLGAAISTTVSATPQKPVASFFGPGKETYISVKININNGEETIDESPDPPPADDESTVYLPLARFAILAENPDVITIGSPARPLNPRLQICPQIFTKSLGSLVDVGQFEPAAQASLQRIRDREIRVLNGVSRPAQSPTLQSEDNNGRHTSSPDRGTSIRVLADDESAPSSGRFGLGKKRDPVGAFSEVALE